MANRLASILEQEYKTKGLVGGTASAVGKAAKEKLDIRNALFSGEGIGSVIGTKIFGKGYSATKREKTGTQKSTSPESLSSALSSGESPVLQEMNANMKLTAKNSMSLPMMARDMNLMKLNIFKLVKSFGDKPNTNKTDMFYEKSKIRDAAYNNTIGKMMGKGRLGTLSKSVFVSKKERDGQTPETALYINAAGAAGGEEDGSVVGDIVSFLVLKKILTATLGFLTGPVGLTILGGFGLFKVIENLMEKNSDKEGVDLATKALGGGLDESQLGSEIMNAAEEGQRQREAESLRNRTVSGPLERLPQVLPDTGAGGGRGFVNPENVSPTPQQVPSNAVTSSSGSPIGTGTPGVYVTSGSAPSTSPTPSKNPLLDMISKGESASAGGYNAMNQGTPGGGPVIGSGDSQKIINKKLTDMTVGEIMDKAAQPNDDAKKRKENGLIFAAGRYQIIPKTLEALVKQGIVSKDDKFDETTQDKLGMALIKGTGALKLAAAGNYEEAQNALAKTWASIPLATNVGDKKAGQSYYQKAGQNTAHANLDVRGALMSGSAIASASTSVSDQKMAAMIPTGGQTTVVNGGPITVGSSKSGSRVSPFQKEFHDKIISAIALT